MAERLPNSAFDRLASRLAGDLGPAAVTAAGAALVVRPGDEDGVAAALRRVSEAAGAGRVAGQGAARSAPWLGIRGRGSKAWWGDVPAGTRILLDTTGLRAGLRHDAGDLVASAPAGLGWAELQDELGRAGQWVPLDPPWAEAATIGGVAAAATSGPRRVANGAVRDLVIGARAVLPGGRKIAAGGRVIKNVAGYDLCKLLVGSFGSLGVITELTFKVLPLPECRGSVTAAFADPDAAYRAALAVLGSELQPAAVQILWHDGRPQVRVDVDGVEAVVTRQLRDLRDLLGRGDVGSEDPLPVASHRDLLGAAAAAPIPQGSVVVRTGLPAGRLPWAWSLGVELLGPLGGRPLRADAAAGLLWWVLPDGAPAGEGEPDGREAGPARDRALAGAVAQLDAQLRTGSGYAALEAGPEAAHRALAARATGAVALSRRIKAVFDPAHLLSSPRLGI